MLSPQPILPLSTSASDGRFAAYSVGCKVYGGPFDCQGVTRDFDPTEGIGAVGALPPRTPLLVERSIRILPGQYRDAETGLFYNYFRDYDPQTGRYVESDPIGLAGGINPYVYVSNAPTMHADPEGLQAVRPPMVRQASTREMVRHPELIQPRPTLRENPGVRDEFMEWAKLGNDLIKGHRELAMRDYLREQGIDLPSWRLPPLAPSGCIYVCPGPVSIQNRTANMCYSDGPESCMLWCGPRMSAR